jgi:hypothetical protein
METIDFSNFIEDNNVDYDMFWQILSTYNITYSTYISKSIDWKPNIVKECVLFRVKITYNFHNLTEYYFTALDISSIEELIKMVEKFKKLKAFL